MNYYEILGIDNNASIKEIKNAYCILVKKAHPDAKGVKIMKKLQAKN